MQAFRTLGKNVIGKKSFNGSERKLIISDYYEPTEWEEPLAKGFAHSVIYRHRTLQEYFKAFINAGLTITDLNEPVPTSEQAASSKRIARLTKIPMVLFLEAKKLP